MVISPQDLEVAAGLVVFGRVLNVEDKGVGSYLSSAASSSDTVLNLDSLAAFDQSGQVVLYTENLTGPFTEVRTFDSIDRAARTMTLNAGLTNAYPVGAEVAVYPRRYDRYAWVRYAGNQLVRALVPFTMRDILPLGARNEIDGECEVVRVRLGLTPAIVDLPFGRPIMDGSYIDPDTLPTPPLTDGDAPGDSPTPAVAGGVGYLAVRWDATTNDDPVTYEVHVSTSTGFTPSGATLAGIVNGTMFFIRKMPDDSDLLYGVTYYVKLVAYDADGAASAGPEGSAVMTPATSSDIAVEAITAGHILAGTITAEQLATVFTITNRLIAGVEIGQRVEIDTDGIRLVTPANEVSVNLPTAEDATATFAGSLLAADITIEDRLRLQGTDNEVSSAAELTIAGGVSAPTSSPSVAMAWDTLALDDSGTLPRRGLFYDPAGGAGGATPSFLYVEFGAGGRLIEVDAADGSLMRTHTFTSTVPAQQPYGVTRVGTNIFVLFGETFETSVWVPGYWTRIGNQFVYIPGHYETNTTNTMKIRKIAQATFATVSNTTLTEGAQIGGRSNHTPGLGTDGTYVCVLTQLGYGQPVTVNRFTTAPAFNDAVELTGLPGGDGLNTPELFSLVAQGGSWWVCLKETESAGQGQGGGGGQVGLSLGCYAFTTGGVFINDRVFSLAGLAMRGTAHDGSVFRSIHEGPQVFEHTSWDWTTESAKYWAAYSWFDSAGTTHETPVSSATPLTMVRRAQLLVATLTSLPGEGGADDPDSIRAYVNRGAVEPTGGSPVRFSGYLQGFGPTSVTISDFDDAGSPPENPSFSDFPSSPALLQSAGGEWQLHGDGTVVGFTDAGWFGDGSDGSLNFDGSATVLGLVPSGGVYTLTRDIYADAIAIDSDAVVLPSSFRIFCRGTLTNDGVIRASGTDGSNGSGGTGGSAGVAGSSADGTWPMLSAAGSPGAGGSGAANGGNGQGPTNRTGSTIGWRFASGAGGDSDLLQTGAAGVSGGTGLAADAPTAAEGGFRHASMLIESLIRGSGYANHFGGSAGGGAGGGSGSNSGGGAGGGSGSICIAAREIINNGAIEAIGGGGGNGVRLGGGGGGGGGGLVGLVYASFSGEPPDVSGGAGGSRGVGVTPSSPQEIGTALNDTVDATSFTTGTTNPVGSNHYLVAVNSGVSAGTPNTPTLSGTGGWAATGTGWVVVATVTWNGGLNRLTLFKGTANSSTNGSISAAFAGQTQVGCQIIRIGHPSGSNWDSFSPVQVSTPATGSSGNASVSLPSAISEPTHQVVAIMADAATAANVTPGSGYTELRESNQVTGVGTLEAQVTTQGGTPSQSAAWTNTSGEWAAMSVEMDSGENMDGADGADGMVIEIAV